MKKTFTALSIAFALALIGGADNRAHAQACPEGMECGWINALNVRSFGVISSTNDGINFYNDQATKDQACRVRGYNIGNWGGYTNLRKWDKCNDEYYVTWNGSDWHAYRCNARTYVADIFCAKDVPNDAPTISWTSAPSSAACDATYMIEAAGSDRNGNLTAVSVDKDGVPFAYNGGGDGRNETSGNPTSDTGPKTVTFTAWATDAKGQESAKISHAVSIESCVVPNQRPTGSLSASCAALSGNASDPDSPGQSIGVHFYVDGPAGSGSIIGATNTNGGTGSYSMSLPEYVKTGTDRRVYAYAIDSAGGDNPEIGQATINCSPATIPAPTGFISANPTKLPRSGGDVTISWSTNGNPTCVATGDWSGSKAASGSETVRVNRSSQFGIKCTNAGGTWNGSANVAVAGTLQITDFYISPSSVKEGDYFTIYGVAQWNGVDYIKRHRAYFQGSQGGQWTYAAGPYATVVTTAGSYIRAEKNPYSMYMGPGSYTVVYEVEDNAGNTDSESRSFTFEGGQQCDVKTHTCSASYTGYEYPQSRTTQSLTVYQSCDISPQQHSALNIPGGTATLMNRAYSDECPQCWYDTHGYQGTTWHCSRTLSGYDHPHFRSTFSVDYYTSCSISESEKQALEDQGYEYGYRQRTHEASPGEWTDVHYMSNCSVSNPNPNNPNPVSTCMDPGASNYNEPGSCRYGNSGEGETNTNTGPGAGAGGAGGGNGGSGGGGGQQPIPGFTISADNSKASIQFLGGIGGTSEVRRIEVNPVNGFNEDVTIRVVSIRSKSSGQPLPEGTVALYSIDDKPFADVATTVQRHNASIGGGRFIGTAGLVGSSFKLSLSKAITEPYEVVFEAVSSSGKTATYSLTIEPDIKNPSFREL